MISKDELLKGRDKLFPNDYNQEISDNLDKLLIPMNQIRQAWGKPMNVNSGWRPAQINAATPGAALHSKHTIGLAVDISDLDGSLKDWVLGNLQLMKDLNIFFEDFRWTPTWVHFQIGAPGSGKRIFVPNTQPPLAPGRWDGQYDPSFNE